MSCVGQLHRNDAKAGVLHVLGHFAMLVIPLFLSAVSIVYSAQRKIDRLLYFIFFAAMIQSVAALSRCQFSEMYLTTV